MENNNKQLENKMLDIIGLCKDEYKINWKFYAEENTKDFALQHITDLLMSDCHCVFRTHINQDHKIDWVGYSCNLKENPDNERRDELISNPSILLEKAVEGSTVYITLGGSILFRYATITLKFTDPPFYEIIDYEAF